MRSYVQTRGANCVGLVQERLAARLNQRLHDFQMPIMRSQMQARTNAAREKQLVSKSRLLICEQGSNNLEVPVIRRMV